MRDAAAPGRANGASNQSRQDLNVVGSCPTCNMRKSAKDPIAWAQEIGLLL